ncbi:MAG: hypothetical protein EZS28_035126, partial [Streblomastix strix]
VKDKIKVYQEGKKAARTLTQAQQTKLLLEARGGGQTKQPNRNLIIRYPQMLIIAVSNQLQGITLQGIGGQGFSNFRFP